MPIAARIVTVEGKKLLDGGIADSIPLRFFQKQGYTRNLVVLTQPEGFVKEPNPLMPLMRIWLHRHPHIVRALEQRHVMYNEELEYVRAEEKKPGTLVLRPKGKLTIGHISHDPSEMQATYDQGREVALKKIKVLFAGPENAGGEGDVGGANAVTERSPDVVNLQPFAFQTDNSVCYPAPFCCFTLNQSLSPLAV